MPIAVLVGTLDTKGREYAFMADRLRETGVEVLLVDVGTVGPPQTTPDITRDEVAAAGGHDLGQLSAVADRGAAMAAMADAASHVVVRLHDEGRLDGLLGLGGSGGTSIVTRAMRALPLGVPKLMISTVASGDTRHYVGASDIAMLHSVVDISGINRISRSILGNAANAMAGMITRRPLEPAADERPLVGATMFGVTTTAVDTARARLEALGYEVLVFHATGRGGDALESLVRDGLVDGVLDLTTTELCDLLFGGVLAPHERRLTVAGARGLPQVVSLGATDMVNFGPYDEVPAEFQGRTLLRHNPNVTLMRTSVAECEALGRTIAERLNRATGPVTLFVPLRGVSSIAIEGQPFHSPEADAALFGALRAHVDRDVVDVREFDTDINDPVFATAMAETLHDHLQRTERG